MKTWRTWLLVRDLDPSLHGWVTEASLFEQFDLSARPSLSVRREGDAAVLRTPDLGRLFNYLNRVRSLYGFSVAPTSDLPFLHGKEFFYQAVIYRLMKWEGPLHARLPYQNRLFRVERVGTVVQRDQQTGQAEVRQGPAEDAAAMFLDPLPIELTEPEAESLVEGLQPGQPYGAITGGCFLPPFRDQSHPAVGASYFGSESLRLRHALRDSAKLGDGRVDEPVAAHLTRLTDEPVLREALLDGASLHMVRGEGEPTTIRLHVPESGRPWAVERARVLLDGQMAGPPWASHVAAALRDDVASLVDAIGPAGHETPYSWGFEAEASNNPITGEGTWHQLSRNLLPRINAGHPVLAEYFRTVLLDPSSSLHEKTYDHSYAERLLMAYAWRCPWRCADGELRAWRLAMLDLLSDELVGERRTPEQRLESWNQDSGGTNRGRAFNAGESRAPNLNVRYMGDPDDNDVLFRRLLLPLGTVLNARTIYLNKGARSQLDRGLVLA